LAPGVAFLLAAEATRLGLVLCPFRRLTHLPCPGCGMTRALLALIRGDLHAALAFHPLSPLVAVALGAWWANSLLEASGRPRIARVPVAVIRLSWVGVAAALMLWVVRLSGYFPLPR
jgi:hypothetical protein